MASPIPLEIRENPCRILSITGLARLSDVRLAFRRMQSRTRAGHRVIVESPGLPSLELTEGALIKAMHALESPEATAHRLLWFWNSGGQTVEERGAISEHDAIVEGLINWRSSEAPALASRINDFVASRWEVTCSVFARQAGVMATKETMQNLRNVVLRRAEQELIEALPTGWSEQALAEYSSDRVHSLLTLWLEPGKMMSHGTLEHLASSVRALLEPSVKEFVANTALKSAGLTKHCGRMKPLVAWARAHPGCTELEAAFDDFAIKLNNAAQEEWETEPSSRFEALERVKTSMAKLELADKLAIRKDGRSIITDALQKLRKYSVIPPNVDRPTGVSSSAADNPWPVIKFIFWAIVIVVALSRACSEA